MKSLASLACALVMLCGVSSSADAAMRFPGNDRPVLIWVTIQALPGEGLWQACRRVYQRDVYIVMRSRGSKVRCKVDHSRMYETGERRQNFF